MTHRVVVPPRGLRKEGDRGRPMEERRDARAILAIIRDAFGERANASQLLRSFYERRQHEYETVTDYSHELAAVFYRLESASPRHVVNRECMLKDQLKLSGAKTVSSTFHLNNREAKRELHVNISGRRLTCHRTPTYLGVKLHRTLTYREHLIALRGKVIARTALIRRLAGTSWGASTPTLRTSTLALVYAPAEYCAPVWCRSSHTRLVDVGINASLRTMTGCLRPTQVDQLPVIAEIAPPTLMREAATLVLGRRECQHDHLLHDAMEKSTHRKRHKSRRPLTHHAHQLVASVPPQETVKHWTQTRWTESWASTTTRLHRYMPTPSNSGQGVGLSRRAWTRLNRLRTGGGRFGANMLRWGLSTSDCSDCGAEQTAEHITNGRCPIYRPPEGIHGHIELGTMTRTWLENCALDV